MDGILERFLKTAAALLAGAAIAAPATEPLRLAPAGGFAPGSLYEFEIRYPTNRSESLSFRTGASFQYTARNRDGSVKTNATERRVVISLPREKGPGNLSFVAWHTSGQQSPVDYSLNAALPEAREGGSSGK